MTREDRSSSAVLGLPLYICRSDTDEDDRQLADQIAHKAQAFARSECLSQRELRGRFPQKIIPGFTIAILSPSVAASPESCRALADLLVPNYTQQYFRHYCLCRGAAPEQLREIPELAPFFDNLMVLKSDQAPVVLEELEDYVTNVMPDLPETRDPSLFWKRPIWAGLGLFCWALLWPIIFAYRLSLVAAIVLLVLWFSGSSRWLSLPLVVLCAFAAGYRVHFIGPSDLAPWLGRRWKLPRRRSSPPLLPAGPLVAAGLILAILAANQSRWGLAVGWVAAGVLGQSLVDISRRLRFKSRSVYAELATRALEGLGPRAAGSRCSEQDLQRAKLGFLFTVYWNIFTTAFAVSWCLVPAFLMANEIGRSAYGWIAASAALGFLTLGILVAGARQIFTQGGGRAGLLNQYANKLRPITSPAKTSIPTPPLDKSDVESFDPEDRPQVLRWLELYRLVASRFPLRPWRTERDYAFISYAWRDDDSEDNLALQLAEACQAAGIKHFLDKREAAIKRAVYRYPVAQGVADCTHFFLVVSPAIGSAPITQREIEMAMQRWAIEMRPAVICIVQRDVAEQLRTDPKVPLTIRFLLTFFPQLTPAEAANPDVVRYLVEFTRRHGRAHDWLPLLSPSTATLQIPGVEPPSARAAVAPIS